jgi:nucleotidyltransferase/DNA polymerase involved in DNA repair
MCTPYAQAKPNGQYEIFPLQGEVDGFMAATPLEDLPGVGHKLLSRLHEKGGYHTCEEIWSLPKALLKVSSEWLLAMGYGLFR